jgi:hypothetical protein
MFSLFWGFLGLFGPGPGPGPGPTMGGYNTLIPYNALGGPGGYRIVRYWGGLRYTMR